MMPIREPKNLDDGALQQHPERPEIMATALREGVEYVDATELIKAVLDHVERLHKFTEMIAGGLVNHTNPAVLRNSRKLIELEADMALYGIGTNPAQTSALVLPDYLKGRKSN